MVSGAAFEQMNTIMSNGVKEVRGQLKVLTLRFDLRGSSLISIHLFKVLNLLKQNNNDVKNRQNLRSMGPVDAILANLRKSFHTPISSVLFHTQLF